VTIAWHHALERLRLALEALDVAPSAAALREAEEAAALMRHAHQTVALRARVRLENLRSEVRR
jgi:hypothetical protein